MAKREGGREIVRYSTLLSCALLCSTGYLLRQGAGACVTARAGPWIARGKDWTGRDACDAAMQTSAQFGDGRHWRGVRVRVRVC